jgi:hypothetical protein
MGRAATGTVLQPWLRHQLLLRDALCQVLCVCLETLCGSTRGNHVESMLFYSLNPNHLVSANCCRLLFWLPAACVCRWTCLVTWARA